MGMYEENLVREKSKRGHKEIGIERCICDRLSCDANSTELPLAGLLGGTMLTSPGETVNKASTVERASISLSTTQTRVPTAKQLL